jgi:hypothetical protein
MWVWIVIAVAVVALAVWAYTRRTGISDADVRRSQQASKADVEKFRRNDTSGGFFH